MQIDRRWLVVVALLAGAAWAQTSQKITLTPAMVTRLVPNNEGDPTKLVDEQALVGNPAAGDRFAPSTNWSAQFAAKRMTARITLPAAYVITQLWLYDANGGLTAADGTYQVIANTSGGDVTLVSDLLGGYLEWRKFDVAPVTTTTLTVVTPTGYIGMPELVVYGSLAAPPPTATPAKLTLTPAMATRLVPNNEGDPTKLVDEQTLVGNPAAGDRFTPATNWGAQFAGKRMTAQLDLGKPFVITQLWLFDSSGGLTAADGTYQVIANTTGGDVTVVSDLLASYMQWKKFDLAAPVTTQKLTVITPTGYIGMPELVIYGYDATATPPPPPPVNQAPVLNAIANLTLAAGTAGSTPLSATDADGDAITLSFVGTPPSFVTLTDSHAGTGSVNVSTQSTAGTFTLTVRA
ncbi:MAG: hypothetical protein JNG84_06945, partial [Archangium sp.]|nr:hypothetical protein [Archangium sp.]